MSQGIQNIAVHAEESADEAEVLSCQSDEMKAMVRIFRLDDEISCREKIPSARATDRIGISTLDNGMGMAGKPQARFERGVDGTAP
jgi:hypothetical protein